MQVESKYDYNSVKFLAFRSSRAQVAAVGHVVVLSLGSHDCVVLILDDRGNVTSTKHVPGVSTTSCYKTLVAVACYLSAGVNIVSCCCCALFEFQ